MHRLVTSASMRRSCLIALLFVSLACDSSNDPGASGTEGVGGSTSGSSTGEEPTSAMTSVSASGNTVTSTTSTSTTEADASSSTEPAAESSSESTDTCPVGTQDCPCDDDACEDGLACVDGTCAVSDACEQDLLEPNDNEETPTLLGEVDDDDDDGGSIFGILDGPDDIDWYRYAGNDTLLGNVDPARFVKADGGLRLCKFAECEGGVEVTEFECPVETEPAVSPAGRPGCCAPAGIALGDANCTGSIDDDMHVFLRIDQAEQACVDYELIYHF